MKTQLQEFWQRYQWHYGIGVVILFSLLMTGDYADEPLFQAWQLVLLQIYRVVSLATGLILVHVLLNFYAPDFMRQRFWSGHALTIILGNFFVISADAILLILGLEAVVAEGHSRPASWLNILSVEYIYDLQYSVGFWAAAEFFYFQITKTRAAQTPLSAELSNAMVLGFLNEIPQAYRQQIDAVEAQQNYIKVYAADQTFMILYRFGKAVEELGDEQGIKTHRSFWVNYSAMQCLQQNGSQQFILTKNGMQVPVSRSFREAVKKLNLPKA
ncbi:MAG: LytTR family DNA-binding domain-containing protein [Pseudomonadota bacterium]